MGTGTAVTLTMQINDQMAFHKKKATDEMWTAI